jgi:hypothetical protein
MVSRADLAMVLKIKTSDTARNQTSVIQPVASHFTAHMITKPYNYINRVSQKVSAININVENVYLLGGGVTNGMNA